MSSQREQIHSSQPRTTRSPPTRTQDSAFSSTFAIGQGGRSSSPLTPPSIPTSRSPGRSLCRCLTAVVPDVLDFSTQLPLRLMRRLIQDNMRNIMRPRPVCRLNGHRIACRHKVNDHDSIHFLNVSFLTSSPASPLSRTRFFLQHPGTVGAPCITSLCISFTFDTCSHE
jgi:hypothetical protein